MPRSSYEFARRPMTPCYFCIVNCTIHHLTPFNFSCFYINRHAFCLFHTLICTRYHVVSLYRLLTGLHFHHIRLAVQHLCKHSNSRFLSHLVFTPQAPHEHLSVSLIDPHYKLLTVCRISVLIEVSMRLGRRVPGMQPYVINQSFRGTICV